MIISIYHTKFRSLLRYGIIFGCLGRGGWTYENIAINMLQKRIIQIMCGVGTGISCRQLTYLLHGAESFLRSKLVFTASQEIPRIFMEPKGSLPYSQVPATVPILSQLHPVPTTPSNSLKIHLNIILTSMSESPQWPLSLRFPHQNPVHLVDNYLRIIR
jgi:hypothetical protein